MSVENFLNKIKNWLNKDRKIIFFTTFIIGLLVHFYLLANGSKTLDGYWRYGSFLSKGWEVSLGRFGLPFIDMFRGTVVSSSLCGILAIIIISISSIFLVETLNVKKGYVKVLMSIFLVVTPTFSITLMYPYAADAYLFAFLAAVLTVYFLNKEQNLRNILIELILVVITLSLYQAYISVTVSIILIKAIIELLQGEKQGKNLLKSILVLICGFILYYIILSLIVKILNLNLSTYGGANSILSINTLKNLIPSILKTYKTVFSFLFADGILNNTGFWHREIINVIILGLMCINFIIIIIQNKSYKRVVNMILLVIFVLLSPICFCFIEIIAQDRSINLLMAESLFMIFILFLKQIDMLENKKIAVGINWLNTIFIVILIWSYILSDNATYVASQMYERQLYSLETNIAKSISENDEFADKPVIIIGFMNFEVKNSKLLELTNFDICQSNSAYTFAYYLMDNIQIDNPVVQVTDEICNEIIETSEYQEMSYYPDKNSIKIINDMVVVKIGK